MLRFASAFALVFAVTVFPTTARAETSAADKAAAEALFQQGLEAMRANKLDEACQKLEQSQAIEPGIGTSLYLAECYEKAGRTASAWGLFREASSEAQARGETERAVSGRNRADQLEPLLSRLSLQVPVGTAVPGLEIVRDGKPVPQGVWNVAVPVDPGVHQILARAAGYAEWSSVVTVDPKGALATLMIPPLSPVATPAPAPAAPPPQTAPTAGAPLGPPPPPANEGGAPGATQRTVALIMGGAGVVSLGVGSYFGLRAISKNNDAKQFCKDGGSTCQDPRGESLTDSAQTAAHLADGFVIGGGVLAAAGVIVYLTAPSADSARVGILTDGHGSRLTLRGAF